MNMNKTFTSILLLFAVLSTAMAQQAPDRNSAFQFGIIPPVSTNGLKMREFTNGVSVNMLLGISKNERYLTVSGAGSIVSGQADELQLSGLFNWTGGGSGLMASSCFNVTRGTFTGLQIAGLVNAADKVRGVQLSTLVNVAQECDFPIGLINIIKNGEMGVAVTCDALGNAIVSFRSGGKYTYGIIGAGYNFRGGNGAVTEAGLGIHIPECRFFRIDNELKATAMDATSEAASLNFSYLAAPSFIIGRHYNIFFGPSINFLSAPDGEDALKPGLDIWHTYENGRYKRAYLGYSVGVQYSS